MLRDNFGYDGNNPAAKELIETINQMAKNWNNFQMDWGADNGGTDIVTALQEGNGFKLDMRKIYTAPEPIP